MKYDVESHRNDNRRKGLKRILGANGQQGVADKINNGF